MAHWVLQNNIYAEEGFDSLVGALERLGIPYTVHKCIPFSGELEPPLPANLFRDVTVAMGSYSLTKHVNAETAGYNRGVWLENLHHSIQCEQWGRFMLNYDARQYPFKFLRHNWPASGALQFVRPATDSKAFTGKVVDRQEIDVWIKSVEALGQDHKGELDLNTPCIRAGVKEIYSETRCWVVDRKVVTQSGYKLGSLKRYSPPESVDRRIIDFAEMLSAWWVPDRAFVMDVADTPDGLRVVEVNNINSSGFYKADMMRLVMALDRCADSPAD
jgi:hypothetical protein